MSKTPAADDSKSNAKNEAQPRIVKWPTDEETELDPEKETVG
jgi:hypothetical protein